MKFTIYTGKSRPAVAVGTNQCRLLGFAERFRGRHSYRTDRAMKRTRYTFHYLTRSGEARTVTVICTSESMAREAAVILRDLKPGQIQTVTESEP